MVPTRDEVEEALREGRLLIKVSRHWWEARRMASTLAIGDEWMIRVQGKNAGNALISSRHLEEDFSPGRSQKFRIIERRG